MPQAGAVDLKIWHWEQQEKDVAFMICLRASQKNFGQNGERMEETMKRDAKNRRDVSVYRVGTVASSPVKMIAMTEKCSNLPS